MRIEKVLIILQAGSLGWSQELAEKEYLRITSWLTKENQQAMLSIEFLECLLKEYYIKEKEQNENFKLSTPFGRISDRKQPKKWGYIEHLLLDWMENGGPSVVPSFPPIATPVCRLTLPTALPNECHCFSVSCKQQAVKAPCLQQRTRGKMRSGWVCAGQGGVGYPSPDRKCKTIRLFRKTEYVEGGNADESAADRSVDCRYTGRLNFQGSRRLRVRL